MSAQLVRLEKALSLLLSRDLDYLPIYQYAKRQANLSDEAAGIMVDTLEQFIQLDERRQGVSRWLEPLCQGRPGIGDPHFVMLLRAVKPGRALKSTLSEARAQVEAAEEARRALSKFLQRNEEVRADLARLAADVQILKKSGDCGPCVLLVEMRIEQLKVRLVHDVEGVAQSLPAIVQQVGAAFAPTNGPVSSSSPTAIKVLIENARSRLMKVMNAEEWDQLKALDNLQGCEESALHRQRLWTLLRKYDERLEEGAGLGPSVELPVLEEPKSTTTWANMVDLLGKSEIERTVARRQLLEMQSGSEEPSTKKSSKKMTRRR